MINIVASVGGKTKVVETTETGMMAEITKMHKWKAAGIDGISVEFLDMAETCLTQLEKEDYYSYLGKYASNE